MTEVNIEPPVSSTVPDPAAPHDTHSPESKPVSSAYNPLSRGLLPVSKLDGSISHLHRLIQTREGHDSVILFLAYTTQLVVSVLEVPKPQALQSFSIKFGQLIQRALPSKKLSILSVPKLASLLSAIPALELRIVERLRALSSMLNDWHTMTRLWGLVTMWMLTKKLIGGSSDLILDKTEGTKSRRIQQIERTVTATQIMSLTWFFVLDNTTWLSMRGILKWSKKPQSKFSSWCARCWCIYVFVEAGRLLHERARQVRGGDKEDVESHTEWKKKFVQVSAWLLLCVDYTSPIALLPGPVAAFVATYAEYITVKGLWDATTEAN